MKSETQKLINKTREYLDYIEEHINNVDRAFVVVAEKCKDLPSIASDQMYFELTGDISSHDISKLSKEEFTQYRDAFFPTDGNKTKLCPKAWENHKKENIHHWQSIMDSDTSIGTREKNLAHMIIDWTAMSYKFGGSAKSFYENEMKTGNIELKGDDVVFIYKIFDRIEGM